MKKRRESIIKSLIIITILFLVFCIGAYIIKGITHNKNVESISIKSTDSLAVVLSNNLPLSDKLAISNDKSSVSDEIFNNIKFEVINNGSDDVNYELYITQSHTNVNEIEGKFIKVFLAKQNGKEIEGFNKNNVPLYSDLRALYDLPGSRILYRGTLKGKSSEKFDLKAWISDTYTNTYDREQFMFSVHVRVM